jgi:hypothetical protein
LRGDRGDRFDRVGIEGIDLIEGVEVIDLIEGVELNREGGDGVSGDNKKANRGGWAFLFDADDY